MDTDFLDHWKTGMVIDELQDKCAPIYILRLWAHCQERKSDCFAMPSRGLKAQCKYEGDHEKFESALVAAGFIERDGDNIKVIGWAEKNASLIAAWENGGRGGRPKKKPTDNPQETHGLATGNPAVTHGQPSDNPSLTQTKPIREDKSREEDLLPNGNSPQQAVNCPHSNILELWAKHLPHLSQPRSWEGSRKANLRNRWIQASKPSEYSPNGYHDEASGLEWWDGFFSYIATDTKLANGFESKDRSWRPDLEWVVNAANFQKIIDGKYDK